MPKGVPPIQYSSFSASLSAFLRNHFKSVMDEAAKNTHPDAAPLVDATLSLLSRVGVNQDIDRDAILGFFTAQAKPLLEAANQICEAHATNGKMLKAQVLVIDVRFITLAPPAATFYDILTNTETAIGPSFMPMETVAYSLGAVYAAIIKERKDRASRPVVR
jgi:hypothetical protein